MTTGKPKSAEMSPGPGFRVRTEIERPSAETVAALKGFETPELSDILNRLYTRSTRIQLLSATAHKLVGPALTVKVHRCHKLMVLKPRQVAQPGEVVVVDSSSSMMTA